jgi:hypothetical protein
LTRNKNGTQKEKKTFQRLGCNKDETSGPYGKGYPRGKKMAPGRRLGGGPPAGHRRVGHDGPG